MTPIGKRSRRLGNKLVLVIAGVALLGLLTFLVYRSRPAADAPQFPAFVSTAAGANGEFGETFGVAFRDGGVYVSDGERGEIRLVRDGIVATFAAGLNTPAGIAFAPDGSLVVADSGSHTIKSIGQNGVARIVAGIDGKAGNTDSDAATTQFRAPIGVAVDAAGRIFVSDTYNDRIRLIENGRVSTIAGSTRGFANGHGAEAQFDTPTGLAIWHDKLLVADTGNRKIRVVEPEGTVWTLAGSGANGLRDGLLSAASFVEPTAIAVSPGGEIFITDGNAIRVISGMVPIVRTISAKGRGLADGPLTRSRFNRPSGLVFNESGELLVADSDNRLVRVLSVNEHTPISPDQAAGLRGTAEEFRSLQPPRWPFDPPEARRDIAGTLGELRGEIKPGTDNIHFHNGLDISGSYGETARFVRAEKVLEPLACDNFGTLRELIRMPTIGYIHIRLGRDASDEIYNDDRFLFERDSAGKLTDVRVPRGSSFKAGEPIGTLNSMNHVHLVAGRSGSEMNAIDALLFPGISDTRPPTIEQITITEKDRETPFDERSKGRPIRVEAPFRVIMRAFDQVDGNSERRRLGLYKAGYQILDRYGSPASEIEWTIVFDRLPPAPAVPFVYAAGSRSGATGETTFNYIVTNRVEGDSYNEGFIDPAALAAGEYIVRAFAADYFGNTSYADIRIVK